MDAKITKVLNRPDVGTIATDSVVQSDYKTDAANKQVIWPLRHYTAGAWAVGIDMVQIPACDELPGAVVKTCSGAEWDAMSDDAGSMALIEGWFKTALEALPGIGVGNVTIL